MFRNFVCQLENRLNKDLPGKEAQFSMAPFARRRSNSIPKENYDPRLSAVLILLFPEGDSIHTILIQRPEYDGVHSGQIAFPGGRFEESDLELKQTALREAFEEVGVLCEKINVIGNLSDIYIKASNFLVKPFVGVVSEKPNFIIDTYEVQKIISVDVFSLNDKKRIGEKSIKHSDGYKIKTPYYEVEGLTVWGATAMIISELNVVVEQSKITFS
ncbi:MAG: CoA pyrophosphatase [Bacteroidetes bacterium]|nr:CoA pyrophosphatase [Bacteroidota bacterium]